MSKLNSFTSTIDMLPLMQISFMFIHPTTKTLLMPFFRTKINKFECSIKHNSSTAQGTAYLAITQFYKIALQRCKEIKRRIYKTFD